LNPLKAKTGLLNEESGSSDDSSCELDFIHINEFTECSAKDLYKTISSWNKDKQSFIPIIVDSYGGMVDSVLAMYDVIKSVPIPVLTIGLGKAMSCGSFLLSAGTKGMRYCAPNCRIMLHSLSTFFSGKVGDVEVSTREIKRVQNRFFHLMAKNCQQPKDYFLNLLGKHKDKDLYITPREAMRHGLVDHIQLPSFYKVCNKTKYVLSQKKYRRNI
jgi:ATP-dependent Clp endopeptidase proteolytic subunit ClpP